MEEVMEAVMHQAPGRVSPVALPGSGLLAGALSRVDWSDAYAVPVPGGPAGRPQDWADAIFRSPPPWARMLFGARELVVPIVGIERGGAHVFDTLSTTSSE